MENSNQIRTSIAAQCLSVLDKNNPISDAARKIINQPELDIEIIAMIYINTFPEIANTTTTLLANYRLAKYKESITKLS